MSPSSRTLSTRAKPKSWTPKLDGRPLEPNSVDEDEAEVVVAEVDGGPLELNFLDEGEAKVVVAEDKR